MKLPLFNYTYQILNIIGIDEKDVTKRLSETKNKSFISNPILATLSRTYFGTDFDRIIISIPDNDLMQTRLTGHVLSFIRKEIEENLNYKNELKRKFLECNDGPFSSVFNEIFVGGYLKYLGLNIKFSSSQENGKPDIEASGELNISSDVKTFPDMEFWLEDQLNSLFIDLINIINKCKNFYIIIFVTNTKGFKKEFLKLIIEFLNTGKTQQGKTCMIMNTPNYAGNQGFAITNKTNNVTFRFIPNFVLGDDDLNKLINKANKQQESGEGEGITWLMFPHPKPGNIERRIVWEVSDIPKTMQDRGIGLVLYEIFSEIDPTDNKKINIKSAADFLLKDQFKGKINRESFDGYISKLLSTPTLIVK